MKVSKKNSLTKNLGDKIERIGEKFSSSGMGKIGRKIYNAVNKLEHVNDKSDKKPV